MLDGFMDRLMESAAAAYLPKLEEMKKARRAELEDMKGKVRTSPNQVEEWFDKEIKRLGNMDVKDMIKNATAGI